MTKAPPVPNASRNSRLAACLFVICYLSFAIRLFLLDAQSIWWDEAISIHLATSSVVDLLANRAAHVHPPLYFLLLKGWVMLAGTSAFSVRFFSAWFNTLLVPAAYACGRRWFDRRTGLLAGILVAVSPLYVIYSQEARVYALISLVYLLLLALSERLTRGRHPPAGRDWLLLVGVEAVGLHLHYTFLLASAYVNLLLLLRLRRSRRERARWLVSLAAVALLCLPWIVAVALNWGAVRADVGAGAPFVEPVPLDHLFRLLWTFQWSGLTAAPGYTPLLFTSLILAVLLAFALAVLLGNAGTRRPTLRLLAHWVVPLSGAFVLWQIKPLSHPRYVALFAVALLLLCGYALARLAGGRWAEKVLAALLGLALLSTSIISLRAYYFDPHFAKDDTRGVAAAIAAHSTASDLVLVPPEDWSVPYYYDGPARVEMVWPGDGPADWQRLTALTGETGTVFLVDYYRATRDPRAILPFALEAAGSLSDRWGFKGLYVRVYELGHPLSSPPFGGIIEGGDFGPLQLTAAWVAQEPPADTAVPVALRWRLVGVQPAAPPCRVGLRLRDADGWEWAVSDDWLLDEGGFPTDRWSAGEEVTTYHVVPLPPGTPPLTFTLVLGIYQVEGEAVRPLDLLDEAGNPQGQSFNLGTVSLRPPLGLETDPYRLADRVVLWETPVELGAGLQLVGATLDREVIAPGQPLFVTLRWHATVLVGMQFTASLALDQEGEVIVSETAPVGGRYPADRWAAGQTVVEHRRLIVPPEAVDGPAAVVLRIGGARVELGAVEIAAGEHLFEPPPMAHQLGVRFGDVAELLGYDLEQAEVTSDEPAVVILYWRALEGAAEADYTVFTHILAADGHLVGQHDGPPAAGTRPTPGWVPGEIIVDRHEMAFREPYTGPARIEVGLYDAATVERVSTESGTTFVLLPATLSVVQP